MPDYKPKMRTGDSLLSPQRVAGKMDVSVAHVYELVPAGYFKGVWVKWRR